MSQVVVIPTASDVVEREELRAIASQLFREVVRLRSMVYTGSLRDLRKMLSSAEDLAWDGQQAISAIEATR